MLETADYVFNKLKNEGLNGVLSIIADNKEALLMALSNGDLKIIDFIGKIPYRTREQIKKAIKLNEYYEIEKDIYRMVLDDCIYLFKKYNMKEEVALIGVLIEKTENNRLSIITKQADFLLAKCEGW